MGHAKVHSHLGSTCKNTLTFWSCRYMRNKLLSSCKPHGFIAPVLGPLVNLSLLGVQGPCILPPADNQTLFLDH